MGNPLQRKTRGQERNYTFNGLNQFASATSPSSTDLAVELGPENTAPFTMTVNGQPATPDAKGRWFEQAHPLAQGQNSISVSATDRFGRASSKTINVTLLPPPAFTYDANGNMIGDGLWTYTWNDENRMVSAEKAGDKKLEFTYDGFGRRRIKKVYSWNSSSWALASETRFVYDGFKQIAQLDSNGNLVKSYVWNGEELLSAADSTGTYFYFSDLNRNITDIANSSGELVAHYEYGPFGDIVSMSGSYADSNPYRFSSEYYDVETGLVYYNYRYYSPEFARWMSRDPIEEEGGWNLYGMCGNDPVKLTDFLGKIVIADNWFDRNIKNPIDAFFGFDKSKNIYLKGDEIDCYRQGGTPIDEGKCCCGGAKMHINTQCCEDGAVVKKVSIWLVKRPLYSPDSWIPMWGPLYHEYVTDVDPTIDPRGHGYGKQPRENYIWWWPFTGGGYILPEDYPYDSSKGMTATKKEVCPKEKKHLTTRGPADSIYIMPSPWNNCQGFAEGCTFLPPVLKY